jgi:hypothetical protein
MPRRLLLSLAGTVLFACAPLAAQNNLPPAPELRREPSRFHFDSAASAGLRELWARSRDEGRERVACMGGDFVDDHVYVRRVLLLEPTGADSTSVSAQASIDTCGPPSWHGTVHTHIALIGGERPYERFSGADRGVMLMWWKRWKRDGMFCVLYTERDAYCEVDGENMSNVSRSAY